ncbi:amino acid adenylation domain-containing protein, partial [Paracoccus siganidrum]
YTLWHRKLLGDPNDPRSRHARQLEFWKQALENIPEQMQMPADRARIGAPDYRGNSLTFRLGGETHAGLARLARMHDASLFMVLHTALAAVLHRLGGSTHFAIGTPVAGRDDPALADMVGMFVNSLALPTDCSGHPDFTTLLARLRDADLAAFDHADLPFDLVVEGLDLPRRPDLHPLFQVMLSLTPLDRITPRLGSAGSENLFLLPEVAKFDLSLDVFDATAPDGTPAGLEVVLEYASDILDETTAIRIRDAFTGMIAAMLDNPAQPISRPALLPQSRQDQLLALAQGGPLDFDHRLIGQRFADRAVLAPDAPALRFRDRAWTAAQLDARVNRLARAMLAQGAGPGRRVALAVTRSDRAIVAILAAFRTGTAFVTIDAAASAARAADMVAEFAPDLALTHGPAAEGLDFSCPVIALEHEPPKDPEDNAPLAQAELPRPIRPDDAAYVIFTSGSTGRPKGVVVPQSAIAMLAHQQEPLYHMLARDAGIEGPMRAALTAPLQFDAAFEELLVLVAGHEVDLIDDETRQDGPALVAHLHHRKIQFIDSTPTFFEALCNCGLLEGEAAPRVVLLGGEGMSPALWQRLRETPGITACNVYGPTEFTVDASLAHLADSAEVTMGRPLKGAQFHILDASLHPVPVGVVGELYIAGSGLAQGYLNRPDLTAERFLANPFAPGRRMYRSGDLARWREDGQVEFVGRADQQLKIRGFRIEPAEIEAAIARAGHPQSAVIARQDRPGRKQLVAYVVGQPDRDALRGALAEALPDYMVPAAFVAMEALPLTPNGKLDRRALPEPEAEAGPRRAPRNPTEAALAELFAEVLGTPEIGIDDSFFALGGDSISSIQLVARARKAGIAISARHVVQKQTVAALALVAQPPADTDVRPAVPATGDLPMTPIMLDMVAQGGDWSRFQQSVLLEMPAPDPDALSAALNDLLAHHPILRARVAGTNAMHIPEIAQQANVLTVTRVAALNGSEWEIGLKAAAAEAAARLDPQQGRLMQAVLFRAGDQARLLLTIHHLAVDGVSWRILLPDLAEALAARANGETPSLAAIATPFREWALAMPGAARDRLDQLPLWHDIAGRRQQPLAERPLDPARDRFGAQSLLHVSLDAATTEALMTHAARRINGGMNDVLLTGLALAVAHWHGHAGLTLNVEGHGREDILPGADLSRSLGWFTSLFPLHLDVGLPGDPARLPAPAIETALKSVKETLAAIPENGIGYGLLRHLTAEGATLADHPTPEMGFNFLGRFESGSDLSGWRIAPEGMALSGGAPGQPLAHALELNALIMGESPRLQADWTWAGDLFGSHDIAELAELWLAALRRIAEVCSTSEGRLLTPSDLHGCALDQGQIDAIETSHAPVAEILPLSPLQQGFLFHALYDRDAEDIYLTQITFTLDGELDPDRLRRAARALLARHPGQTASFLHEGLDRPVQVIPASPRLPWRQVTLDGPAEAALAALQDQDMAQPMPLHQGPLLRFTLARETAQRHHLVLTSHHIIMDGWSTPLFLHDLLALYHADGDDAALPAIPAWRDYLAWLDTHDEQAAMRAWHDAFEGLEQPALLAGGVVAKAPARLHVDYLPEDLGTGLQALSRDLGVTLNTLIQTAWAMVLRTELGRDDVVLGSTTSGRSAALPGIEQMVGLFINTIPLRLTLRPAETLADTLRRIQREHAVLMDHDHLGLAQIQKAVGQGSLFDTLVVFENYPMGDAPQAGLEARFSGNRGGDTSHYPVSIGVTPGERFEVKFSTRPDVIAQDRADRLRRRFVAALELLARHSDQRLARLSLLEEGEASLIAGPRDDRPAPSLIEAFEAQAAATPDQIALVCEDLHLDWATLSARVNRLARHLVAHGAAPGQTIAIALPRGAEGVIAMLAIARSGAAWVTLDLDQPDERLRDMAQRADCRLILGSAAASRRLDGLEGRWILLDEEITRTQLAALPDHARGLPVATEGDLAYVIFTSGSTGQPKGVRIAQGNIANLLAQHRGAFYDPMREARGRRLRMAVSAPFSFDTSLAGLLWMVSGHELHVLSDDDRRDGFRMVSYCRDRQIDAIDVGPTHFEQLREIGLLEGDQKYPSIVAFGGEAVSPAQWRSVQLPGVTAFNAYGPTEGTIDSTFAEVTGEDVVIGRPLRNGQIAILDASLHPVPIGVVGELYIAGSGLAQGYLNRPDLTAERFLANPFAPGRRMYRSGDLARWREDGQVEFVGRADQQLKIRGFRIEPAEIEAAIARAGHPQSAVIAREDRPGQKQLVAYVVGQPDRDALRSALAEALPDYMVPAAFVAMEALPLTPNGKLDRRALPEPEAEAG